MKPFVTTLVVLTLIIALYQLPPSTPQAHFLAYRNAAALFVHMGAYRDGPFAFAIFGLAQISAVNGDITSCVSAVSGDISAHYSIVGVVSHYCIS
ncbi:hypothetical protein AAC387_Pa02g3234 [Persea americana]